MTSTLLDGPLCQANHKTKVIWKGRGGLLCYSPTHILSEHYFSYPDRRDIVFPSISHLTINDLLHSNQKKRTIFFYLEPMLRSLMAAFISRKKKHTHTHMEAQMGLLVYHGLLFLMHITKREKACTQQN
jgi:hypothetical protein